MLKANNENFKDVLSYILNDRKYKDNKKYKYWFDPEHLYPCIYIHGAIITPHFRKYGKYDLPSFYSSNKSLWHLDLQAKFGKEFKNIDIEYWIDPNNKKNGRCDVFFKEEKFIIEIESKMDYYKCKDKIDKYGYPIIFIFNINKFKDLHQLRTNKSFNKILELKANLLFCKNDRLAKMTSKDFKNCLMPEYINFNSIKFDKDEYDKRYDIIFLKERLMTKKIEEENEHKLKIIETYEEKNDENKIIETYEEKNEHKLKIIETYEEYTNRLNEINKEIIKIFNEKQHMLYDGETYEDYVKRIKKYSKWIATEESINTLMWLIN